MDKVIVLSGHGGWRLSDGYTQVPGKSKIKFYTMNAKLLSDGLGGGIDQGKVDGLEPDQEGGAFATVPNMRLYPPDGLNIRTPPSTWRVVQYPGAVPSDDKSLQVTIQGGHQDGVPLSKLFAYLGQAIVGFDVTFLWSACRELGLAPISSGFGESIGVNVCQR